jgi:hypothetical protein
MNKILENAVAVPGIKGQPEEKDYPILGSLVWYSLRDVRITREDLAKLFVKHNLNPKDLPPVIREPDAFRRATSDIGQRAAKPLPDGTFEVIMVREVASTTTEIVRHVIREIRDSKNKKLSYEQIGSFIFNRETNDFHAISSQFPEICKGAQELYREYKEFMTGKHIREMVHSIVEKSLPVTVRPGGGVYFMSKEYQLLVDSLEGLVSDLNPYGVAGTLEAQFESIPILDLAKQRRMLSSKYEAQCATTVDVMLGELAEIQKDKKEPSKVVKAKYVNNMKELQQGITKYEALLSQELSMSRLKGRDSLKTGNSTTG